MSFGCLTGKGYPGSSRSITEVFVECTGALGSNPTCLSSLIPSRGRIPFSSFCPPCQDKGFSRGEKVNVTKISLLLSLTEWFIFLNEKEASETFSSRTTTS